MSVQWQTLQLPLAAGLNQGLDARAKQPPSLDVAHDIQFNEQGGIQTRYPFALFGDTFGASDIRKIYANDTELLVFTKERLYSRNAIDGSWTERGTHLAVEIDEQPRFDNPDDQYLADKAELNNLVFYTWYDSATSSVWAAVADKATGSPVLAPASFTGYERPRVIAAGNRFLLLMSATGLNKLVVRSYPITTSINFGVGDHTVGTAGTFDTYYDVIKDVSGNTAICVQAIVGGASYTISHINSTGSIGSNISKARACSGPITVSQSPDGNTVQVIRANAANIQGDKLQNATAAFADVTTGQAVGTVDSGGVPRQLTCAHRSVTDSGAYRCYAFWSDIESVSLGWTGRFVKYNYVDTAGTLGTQAVFKYSMELASRAFDYSGQVYFWGVFGEDSYTTVGAGTANFAIALQNTYLLYRDDGFLAAKAAPGTAAGFVGANGILPGVQLTSGTTGFSWCGGRRYVINMGGNSHTNYANRAPLDIAFSFDSNKARRVARLGSTLYIACGEGILQYDGEKLTECGFHVYPWLFTAVPGAAGAIVDGTYAYKCTWGYQNAAGDRERSTSVAVVEAAMTGGPKKMTLVARTLTHTHKTTVEPAVEVWRTAVTPTAEAPFFLTTSKDPGNSTNPNRYLANGSTTYQTSSLSDNFTDAVLTLLEIHPENGGVLESLSPPPCKIVVANDTRLFLAGVSGSPNRIWYSKLRGDGEIAAFNDALTVDVPANTGPVTAMGFLNETLIVFTETGTYALAGDGYDNVGNGQNYGPARLLASDVGAIDQEAVTLTAEGLLFKSGKGWYLLNRGWAATYIGNAVSDYDSEIVRSIHALDSKHEIRCLTESRMLVLDTLVNQWAEWTIPDGDHATVYQGTYYYTDGANLWQEQTEFASLSYGLDIETAWIKLNDLQGAGRVRAIQILGEYRSIHNLRIRIAYNYDTTWVDDKYWVPSPTTVGGPLQVRHGPSRQNVESIKIRLTAVNNIDTDASPPGEALKLTGLALEVGVKPTLFRRLPSTQRQ